MLNSLYELGKLWIEKENLDAIDILVDAKKLQKNTKKVILVELDKVSDNSFEFNKVSLKDYDPKDNGKYLYRFGSPSGTDVTPSCLLNDNIHKPFNNRFLKWFKKNSDDNFIEAIYNNLYENKDSIFEDVLENKGGLDASNSKNVILTLGINNDGELNYLGDFEIFRDKLKSVAFKDYYHTSRNKDIKGIGACFLCDSQKEVFGLVLPSMNFKFSTIDKKGNLSDFNVQNQWKQVPICGECALYLEAGKKFVEKFLSFKEFGLNFYVIPNFLFNPQDSFDEIFNRIVRFENSDNYEDVVIKESKLFTIVDDLDDSLEFKFLFYNNPKTSVFNIENYVESTLPTWMNKIFNCQKSIISLEIFSEDSIKKNITKKYDGDILNVVNQRETYKISKHNWLFGFLRTFFLTYSFKFYLELVTSVLSEKKINSDFLLSRFMEVIRNNFSNEKPIAFKMNILKSLALFSLLSKLNLLKGGNILFNNDINLNGNLVDSILDGYDKKACFLLGALTRRLTYKQYKSLNSSPFEKKLYGLSLDEKKIKKLYPMVINKLREYNSVYITLEENIAFNLLNAEDNWELTRDETSYYFSLGYTLSYSIGNDEDEILQLRNVKNNMHDIKEFVKTLDLEDEESCMTFIENVEDNLDELLNILDEVE